MEKLTTNCYENNRAEIMARLSINLNKVALLRNQRAMPYPSVRGSRGKSVVAAGAEGITVHPSPR